MDEKTRKINVLFLEDNPDDVELELYELGKGGFDVTHEVARGRKDFFEKIESFPADIIIADYSLPDITGIDAIHICKDKNIELPIILITGMGNEQIAVDSLREGAIDYILKKNITGFPARVARALEIWAAQAERKHLQQQLLHSQKMESIGTLAGGIAHDFNNILTGIMGYASLSIRKLPPEHEARAKMQEIIKMSQRAADLTKQLLVFSRKIPLEFKHINLNSFVEKTVEFMRRMVVETINIKMNFQEEELKIQADEGQLTQVLMNLCVNANDAMGGSGTLEFKTRRFYSVDALPRFVCISVSDTGSGIKEEDLAKIFDPFFTTKDVGKGTGLGLSIVYSVVNAHGGWVDVDSELGKGTTFKVFLPIVAEDKLAVLTAPAMYDSSKLSGGSETILVVEDEEILRYFSYEMLVQLGYKVLTAKNGREALDIYLSEPDKIDLVVSDQVMPEKTGTELFAELKKIKPGIKFILVTGYHLGEVDKDLLNEMQAVLMKPYTTEKIAKLIRMALEEE